MGRGSARGLKTIAKIQPKFVGTFSVPYIQWWAMSPYTPPIFVQAKVDGLMLVAGPVGGTHLRIWQSISIWRKAVKRRGHNPSNLLRVAARRFGNDLSPAAVNAWKLFQQRLCEFPFNGILVYSAPLQSDRQPALWKAHGLSRFDAFGFPYDSWTVWRAISILPKFFIHNFKVPGDLNEHWRLSCR